MLKIEGKTFMNIQEAVQWLLENNALPFQCTANYAPNTEIGLGTIVNPTPAKVRIGSLIFFADSKVSTVVGITENGFICSDQYNNLVDDLAYVTDIDIDASGHLITTLSDGQTIDAGIIKQVSSFDIDASQHLIVSYNDGTSADLGAIFNGNVNIAGNLTADSIIENMSGYDFLKLSETAGLTREFVYAGVVKNGNKITYVVAVNLTRTGTVAGGTATLGFFQNPSAIQDALYPSNIGGGNYLDLRSVDAWQDEATKVETIGYIAKGSGGISAYANKLNDLTLNTKYYFRYEATFLLSNNLAS